MTDKNCYSCIHRRSIIGDCHSACAHPRAGRDNNPLAEIISILGRRSGAIGTAASDLNIRANKHGVDCGWFAWPYNFDPVWLENCDGYEKKQETNKA